MCGHACWLGCVSDCVHVGGGCKGIPGCGVCSHSGLLGPSSPPFSQSLLDLTLSRFQLQELPRGTSPGGGQRAGHPLHWPPHWVHSRVFSSLSPVGSSSAILHGETESSTRPVNLDKSLYLPQHCCSPYVFNVLFIEHLLHVRHRKTRSSHFSGGSRCQTRSYGKKGEMTMMGDGTD